MQKMFLITDAYPFGYGEASFIEPELEYLKKKYDITLIAKRILQSENVCSDLETISWVDKRSNFFVGFIKTLFSATYYKEIYYILKSRKGNAIKKCISATWYSTRAYAMTGLLNKLIKKDEPVIIYTYWFDWGTLGALYKKREDSNIKVVTRTHGADLYEDRIKISYQPYKTQMKNMLDLILFVSEQGKKYFSEHYHQYYSEKLSVNYLGVKKQQYVGRQTENNFMRLVSCSNIYPLKRINLIIESLALIQDIKIQWVHIGGRGALDYVQEIKDLAEKKLGKKENIEYSFLGYMTNEEVIDFYKKNYVDCFISTSESEGLPVSMMEAISFGIPLIATNVGGVSEIVSEENGFLISANPKIFEIADAIKAFYQCDKETIDLFRKNSYQKWENKFDINITKNELMKKLSEVCR